MANSNFIGKSVSVADFKAMFMLNSIDIFVSKSGSRVFTISPELGVGYVAKGCDLTQPVELSKVKTPDRDEPLWTMFNPTQREIIASL